MEPLPQEHLLGLPSLLELALVATGASGALVYSAVSGTEYKTLGSLPRGLEGKRHALSAALIGTPAHEIVKTKDLILPSGITAWLGLRPCCLYSLRVGVPEEDNHLVLWWKDEVEKPEEFFLLAKKTGDLVGNFLTQYRTATQLQQLQLRLNAVLANVAIGIIFVDSLKESLVNPVAAALLHMQEGLHETATVITAIQATRASCEVEKTETATGESAEYWIWPDRTIVLRVESHALGDSRYPGRFWAFTDVKPLWDTSITLKSANKSLEHNIALLAEEIELRMQAENELRRLTEGLSEENQRLEIAKLESDLLANLDTLTGLSNRRGFRRALDTLVAEAEKHGERIALLFIDLDKFKQVNDTLGHDRGDELLRSVADILSHQVRQDDLLGRLGGDEFVCAMRLMEESNPDAIDRKVGQIIEALNIPVEGGAGQLILVQATVGVAIYPDQANSVSALLTAADTAMYNGKRRGGNRAFYFNEAQGSEMSSVSEESFKLEGR